MMWEKLARMYEENIQKGMTEDDAYMEAYAAICSTYEDADIDKYLDGRTI